MNEAEGFGGGILVTVIVHVNIGMVGTLASFTLAIMKGAASSPSLGGIVNVCVLEVS